jgi:hypothetical protein
MDESSRGKNVDRVTNKYKIEDIKDNTWTNHPQVKTCIDSRLDRKLKILQDKTWMNHPRAEKSNRFYFGQNMDESPMHR